MCVRAKPSPKLLRAEIACRSCSPDTFPDLVCQDKMVTFSDKQGDKNHLLPLDPLLPLSPTSVASCLNPPSRPHQAPRPRFCTSKSASPLPLRPHTLPIPDRHRLPS